MTILSFHRWSLAVAAVVFVSGTGGIASAQSRSHGYVFGGISYSGSAGFHVGGGGEAVVYKGLGVGGELGYFGPFHSDGNGFGALSANGSYQFPFSNRIVGFATAGYSLFFSHYAAHLFNFGGGIHLWTSESRGVRIEYRNHVWPARNNRHLQGIRIGFEFSG